MTMAESKLLQSKSGFLWCPCGFGPIGLTCVGFERKGEEVIRVYYYCLICKQEYDFTKTAEGWDYQNVIVKETNN